MENATGSRVLERAIAYLRTSSAANVEGDSAYRQNDAVMAYAGRAGLEVDSCFWDAAVSGADEIQTRPGFVALLDHVAASGITVVIVEDATRFARTILAQELGVVLLARRGVRLFTSTGQELSDDTDPTKVMLRQIGGAVSQYDKARIVARLRAGRDRARAENVKRTGNSKAKCEGRKSHAELQPDLQRQAKRLRRRNPKTGAVRSIREVANELAALGFVAKGGKPLSPSIVLKLLA